MSAQHPVATGGNTPGGTNPEDRLLEAFSCLARADREVAMLAVSAEAAGDDDRAEALEETIRALHTARKHLRVATRGWIGAPTYDARDRMPVMRLATSQDVTEGRDINSRGLVRVRDDEKLTDAERLAKWGYRLGEEPVTPRQVRDAEKL